MMQGQPRTTSRGAHPSPRRSHPMHERRHFLKTDAFGALATGLAAALPRALAAASNGVALKKCKKMGQRLRFPRL